MSQTVLIGDAAAARSSRPKEKSAEKTGKESPRGTPCPRQLFFAQENEDEKKATERTMH